MTGSNGTTPRCSYCEERVLPHEARLPMIGGALHLECGFRGVAGSVAHIERRCGCYVPGSDEGDPPGLTKREAARAALAAFRRKNVA